MIRDKRNEIPYETKPLLAAHIYRKGEIEKSSFCQVNLQVLGLTFLYFLWHSMYRFIQYHILKISLVINAHLWPEAWQNLYFLPRPLENSNSTICKVLFSSESCSKVIF